MNDGNEGWSNVDGEEDDRDLQEDGEDHPAENATVAQGDKKPDTITIDLSAQERATIALKACEKWDEIQALKEQVQKLNARKKLVEKDHALYAKQAMTGKAEVAADQVDMFRRPTTEGQPVGPQAASQAFGEMAATAEAATAAVGTQEPPAWKPEHHADTCPAKQGPLHGCDCGWNRAQGYGPVAGETFTETSKEELEAQGGRGKKNRKAA